MGTFALEKLVAKRSKASHVWFQSSQGALVHCEANREAKQHLLETGCLQAEQAESSDFSSFSPLWLDAVHMLWQETSLQITNFKFPIVYTF